MFLKIIEDYGELEDVGKNGGFQMILLVCEFD